jgi:HIP---CoA ligase
VRGDLEWGSIPRLVRIAADRYPTLDGLVDGDVRLTFPQLADAIEAACRAAMANGLRAGDRAAIWAPNTSDWVIAALGLLSAGAVLVPVNTRFKGAEAAWILAKSGARALFCVNGFLGNDYVAMLRGAGVDLPELETVVVLRGESPTGTVAWSNYLAAGTLVTEDAAEERMAAVAGGQPSDIIFTSGTTGRPKGG